MFRRLMLSTAVAAIALSTAVAVQAEEAAQPKVMTPQEYYAAVQERQIEYAKRIADLNKEYWQARQDAYKAVWENAPKPGQIPSQEQLMAHAEAMRTLSELPMEHRAKMYGHPSPSQFRKATDAQRDAMVKQSDEQRAAATQDREARQKAFDARTAEMRKAQEEWRNSPLTNGLFQPGLPPVIPMAINPLSPLSVTTRR